MSLSSKAAPVEDLAASGAPEAGFGAPVAGLTPGVVLNHIYVVRRFIARGGMGEVYEGVNVNTEERVAIKVILPHLAEDPNIQALFRREARILTRLSHPAVVQYRVLAEEPELGVRYIVTEFVDGEGLHEVIGELEPDEAALRALTRRLADGLRAAHALGAIHRDLSPDNILLPGGRLDGAMIIDFGIVKDLDTPQATMVGEAFVGKLGYVAPEQFGDFDRRIGPWTDVYSLGLVILALASGGSSYMGATLAEAVDRRRSVPDLGCLPESMRPAFARMLAPDPAQRLRSMDEVLAALDAPPEDLPPIAPTPEIEVPPDDSRPPVAAVVILSIIALLGFSIAATVIIRRQMQPPPPRVIVRSAPELAAEANLDKALRAADCAWMTDRLSRGPDGLHLELSGAAADPAAASAAITNTLVKAGAPVALVDHAQMHALPPAACAAVTAAARLHAASSEVTWVRPQAVVFHPQPSRLCGVGPQATISVITLRPPPAGGAEDLALLRLDERGAFSRVFSGLAEFRARLKAPSNGKGYLFEDLGPGGLRVSLCDMTPGLKGVLALRGAGALDLGLPALDAPQTPAPADVNARLSHATGWRGQMAWYQVEAASPASAAPPRRAQHRPGPSAKSGAPAPPPAQPQTVRPDTLGTDFK